MRLAWPMTKLLISNVLILSAGWISLAVLSANDGFSRHLALTFFTLLFLFAHFEFLIRYYRYFLYVIVITDKKIHRIKKTLLILDDHQSVDLWMLQDIAKHQLGILQNLLGYGTIICEAQETVLRLHYIPHVVARYRDILHLREQARARMLNTGSTEYVREKMTPTFKQPIAQPVTVGTP